MGFMIALLCASLSGMGVGGGGLLLIYLALFTETAQRQAQLYNLVFFIAASASSLLVHALKRKISPEAVMIIALGGIPGAFAGGFLSGAAGDEMLGYIFGGFLLASGAVSLIGSFGKKKKSDG